MREIKFRAWDKDEKRMTTTFSVSSQGQVTFTPLGESTRYLTGYILMQFTGLLDKNGKEIYEGDIIVSSFSPNKVEVVEINNISHFDGNFSHIQGIGFVTELDIDNLEIIGNVWENPKLLEVER